MFTLDEIRELIKNGCTTIDEIKRLSRCGMGPCQGRTCRSVVSQELSKALNIPLSEVKMTTFRQPMKPVKLGAFLGGDEDEE
jgi:bacterioferritin-associated ferredoxin